MYNKKWYDENRERVAKQRKTMRQGVDPRTVSCSVCQREVGIKGFSSHLKMHKISMIEYVRNNLSIFEPFGWQFCSNCNKEVVKREPDATWATCSKECFKEYRSKYLKEQGHPFLGRSHNQEAKDKISKKNKDNLSDKSQHPFFGKSLSIDHKLKISNSQKNRAAHPNYKNPMQDKTHTPESIAKICKDRVGSSLELKIRELLENSGYEFTHQFFVVKNGRSYSFDFKLKGLPILIEADGDYWHGGPGVKKHFFDVERVRKIDKEKELVALERNYRLVRVWESELKTNPEILIEKIKNVSF